MATPIVQTDRDRLEAMIANTVQPVLTEDEIETLLFYALVPDSQGRWTDDADYVETFDLNKAAAEGWRRKAGKVAADYSITIEGRGLNRDEMMANMLKMAETYEKRKQVRSFRADGGMDPFYLWSRER